MYLLPLKRKISRIEIDKKESLSLFPKKIIKVLEVLSQEKNMIIKGGFAKAILGQILKNEGKIKKNMALENEKDELPDIDLILTFTGTKNKSLPALTQKTKQLTEKLKTIEFELNNRDIELIKGTPENERMIRRILESRDITINEIVLVPKEKGGYWVLYHTDKALRDTISAVGVITLNSPNNRYFDYGRIRASFYGLTRLIRFLTEGKVKYIYLPSWWIERTKKKAKEENKLNLGLYGTILAQKYKNSLKLQKRFMTILNDLGLTSIKNFKDYEKEQSQWFESKIGKKFEVDKTTAFEEVQKQYAEKKERYMGVKQRRKQLQTSCSHFIESFKCIYCPENCKIKYCSKCKKLEVTPKKSEKPVGLYQLPCNKSFVNSDFYWKKDAFYPKLPEKKS
ncbi:MAG: hypothetical protein KJI70_00065 [Patescibacteria group bacterium]|nr:hypothetical protein [Patescibacteria group bacterium]